MRTKPRRPTLKFGPTASISGFTSFGTASFNNLQPARIIRELIQNSLDAAVEAGEPVAVVRFRVKKMGREDVPDLRGYEKAFKEAIGFHSDDNGQMPDAAQQVVDNINSALRSVKKGRHHSLTVLDNGIGLDAKRMNSLLGDGASVKPGEGTGSYGVGHLAAIPTSDLRYVLYGAVEKGGKRIAAGSTVLAGRPGTDNAYAAEGYLVRRLLNGQEGRFYGFMSQRAVPDLMKSAVDEIESEWGHGTAVLILAFNHFGESPSKLWDIVSTVASRNFNVAIHEGNLIVEVSDQDGVDIQRLDHSKLPALLEGAKDNVRSPRVGSLFTGLRMTGQNAFATYLALSEGESLGVHTECGDVNLRLLASTPTGRTRVDLYRNGMWITERVRGLERAEFADYEPFCAVLELTRGSGEFQRLVRKAEGPMHDELDFKRLAKDEAYRLQAAIDQVAERIKAAIPKKSAEGYTPDDYLVVDTGGDNPDGRGRSFSVWGSPVIVQARRRAPRLVVDPDVTPDPDPDPDGPRRRRRRARRPTQRRTAPPLEFRSTVVPNGEGNCNITLASDKPLEDVLLSLRVDENSDATCDRIGPDEDVTLTAFTFGGGASPSGKCRLASGGDNIRLRGLDAGVSYELDVSYQVPEGLRESVKAPVFRVELRRSV